MTVGQALVIGAVLLVGFVLIPNRFSLLWLLLVLGGFGWLMNRLFKLILGWVGHPDESQANEDDTL